MSYGWLTESAILPKKSKQIKTKQSGIVGMQAAMLELKGKINNDKKTGKSMQKPDRSPNVKEIKRNSGIAERIQKDEQESMKLKEGKQKNTYKYLEKKAAVYDQIMKKKKNVSALLVDFEGRQEIISKKEQQQYDLDREDFYNGKLSEVAKQQKYLHENIETEKAGLSQVRERLAWEKETLNQLKRGGEEIQYKPKVIQSFDHKLSKGEKQALGSVLEEEQRERIRLEEIKRRKQALEHERIRKLKSLNIMKKGDDEKVTPLCERQKQN